MVDIDLTQVDTTHDVSPKPEIGKGLDLHAPRLNGAYEKAGFQFLMQQLRASLARLSADLLSIALLFLLALFVGANPAALVQLSIYSGVLLVAFFLTLQYPGTGVHSAIALRQTTVVISLVIITMLATQMSASTLSGGQLMLWACLWCASLVLIPVLRAVSSRIFSRFEWWTQPVIILGNDYVAGSVYRALDANRTTGLRPLGIIVDSREQWEDASVDPDWVLGTAEEIATLRRHHQCWWVANAINHSDPARSELALLEACEHQFPIRLSLAMNQRNQPSIWNHFVCLDRFTLIKSTDRLMLPIHRWVKRASDMILALLILIFISPLLAVLSALVRFTSRGPVFFKSQRVGMDQGEFHMTKFRTMYTNGDEILARYLDEHPDKAKLYEQNVKLEHDPRITPIGNFLRRSSLDELPQLLDVLMGRMSLVGPRPMLLEEREKYGDVIWLYHRVLPGITGMWQVSGRNNTSYEQRLHYVAYYIQNWSPWLDLCILAKTLMVVTKKEGAY